MARSAQVSVGPGTAVLLADAKTLGGGTSVTILNPHASEILYVGGDENQITGRTGYGTALSSSTGFRLAAGKAISLVLDGANEAIYGISGNATVTISAHVFSSNFRAPKNFA